MDPNSPITEAEILYRCIRSDRNRYRIQDGRVEFSPSAFGDRSYRPSVDRAVLCNHDPSYTKRAPSDGIAALVAKEVRSIRTITKNAPDGQPIQSYEVDIEPRPLAENRAHSQIYLTPECPNDGVFDKLKARLAWLATQRQWVLAPEIPPTVD